MDVKKAVKVVVSGLEFTLWRGSLPERNMELAYILMIKFPFCVDSPPELIDTNSSYSRLCPQPAEGDVASSPWCTAMPTVTGNSRMVVRYCHNDTVYLRAVAGVEILSIIGWDYTFWRPGIYADNLLLNLGGNAFSAFAVCPMLMCAVAGQGVIQKLVESRLLLLSTEEEFEQGGEVEEA